MNQALAMVIEALAQLPMSGLWGLGLTASSDGQYFPAARQGEAMNLVNARYGSEPGLKAYTRVSDQFGPFATQTIPATVNEAPYILDGLLMTCAGRRIREQYAAPAVSPTTSSPSHPCSATGSSRVSETCRRNGSMCLNLDAFRNR